MDRFVTRGVSSLHRPAGSQRQRRLEDLGKVVRLDKGTTALNFANEDLLRAKAILDAQDSSDADLLTQLRKLSVYMIQESNLLQSQLGHSVRRLKQSGCPEVKQLAARLIEKWRAIIKETKQPPRKQLLRTIGCRDRVQKVSIKQQSSVINLTGQNNQRWQDIAAVTHRAAMQPSRNAYAVCKPSEITFP